MPGWMHSKTLRDALKLAIDNYGGLNRQMNLMNKLEAGKFHT